MIIDFHTHIFPDALAPRAVGTVADAGGVKPALDGTYESLVRSMQAAGIDYAVTLPIATKPQQSKSINTFAIDLQKKAGVVSFGGVHPFYEDWQGELVRLKKAGIRGIKLHPDYQGVYVDDPAYVELLRAARDLGLIVVIHGGKDIAFPKVHHCTPQRLRRILPDVKGLTLVAAHFGGWQCWDEVENDLTKTDIYIDTSFTIGQAPPARVRGILQKMDPTHVLFGSDSPWDDQKKAVEDILSLPISEEYQQNILGENARRLLF